MIGAITAGRVSNAQTACVIILARWLDAVSGQGRPMRTALAVALATALVSCQRRDATLSTDPMVHRGSDRDAAHASSSVGASPAGIPITRGMTITSALHFAGGDRENVVTLADVAPRGVLYTWHMREHMHGGRSIRRAFRRFVSANDLARAPRLNEVFSSRGEEETPGYTAMAISRESYTTLMRSHAIPYAATYLQGGQLGGAFELLSAMRVTMHGTLTRLSPRPESMSILLDGRRTQVPVIHIRGTFSFQDQRREVDYWVLADSTDPLILREAQDHQMQQVIRIDRPGAAISEGVEDALRRDCRAELPGIYFGSASADLDPASQPALAALAALLARHPAWSLSIEGHTDSVGRASSNEMLSERRAQAVRSALISQFHIDGSRLTAAGFGATRPRESNATVEGRARNRRVEAVRPCGRKS